MTVLRSGAGRLRPSASSSIFPLPGGRAPRYGGRMRTLWTASLLFLTFLVAGPGHAAELHSLEITSKTGVHVFTVELADDEAAREKGLMFRKNLPLGQGMLFDFHVEQEVGFWMKNTYIPLDMLFIQDNGRILRIAENTTPLSEAIIPSGGPIRAVLEVIGGSAEKFGIQPGDVVSYQIFNKPRAQ
jgi:uncharacterized membrane protein (UPF0127 family)